MNIYKGNLVRIKSLKWYNKNKDKRLGVVKFDHCVFSAYQYCGKVLSVVNINDGLVNLKDLISGEEVCNFPIESIEEVVSPKSLLRPGYIVETEGGSRLIISVLYEEKLYLISNFALIRISDIEFNDNLESGSLKINKIYKPLRECCISRLGDINESILLWERPKTITLTKEEIAEKLGIDPKKLNIV